MNRSPFHMLIGHLDIFFCEISIHTLAHGFFIGWTSIFSRILILELVIGINDGEALHLRVWLLPLDTETVNRAVVGGGRGVTEGRAWQR